MQRWLAVCLTAVFVALWAGNTPLQAQIGTGSTSVGAIRVIGAQRIEQETVLTHLSFKRGDRISAQDLDKSLKSLFKTGLFADVSLAIEGNVVVVRVVENPIINRVAFEGNRRISDDAMRAEVQLRPRVVFTRSKVKTDTQRILELYRRSGRFGATVEPKVIQLEQNRVDLVFEIKENELTQVRAINFFGNRRFSDGTLRGVIQTKESAWWRILSSSDTYDPDRLAFDRELLRRYYLREGYADFRVVSVVSELTADKQGFVITITLEEGERYRFAKVDVTTKLQELDIKELRDLVTIEEGDWYNADEVEGSISKLNDAAGTAGFAFVEVKPRIKRNREKRTIDMTFDVQEGPKVFVERININGNVRTVDEVIRREVLLVPGDAFNTSKLRRSRRRINNLGFFEKVEVENVPGSAPDQTVVNVGVREKSTGAISFGLGVSSSAGVIGDVTLRERNLVGKGQDLRLRFKLGAELQQVDLSFTEPYFLDRPISAGIDLFNTQRDLQDESSFDRETLGGALRMGYALQENLFQRWRYGIRQDDITNVAGNASVAVKQQQGRTLTSEVSHSLAYDTRDNRFEPTKGFTAQLTTTYAGLGGDVEFLRNVLKLGIYFPIVEDWILSLRSGGGYIFGLDQDVRIVDRFFLGGSNLRGFENAGAGPRDVQSGDSLGGNWIWYGTLETSFPIGLPTEFGIRGRIFSDAGSIGVTEEDVGEVHRTESIRLSVGVGLSWVSPFGPIKLDFARALMEEDFDKTETFRFSFGTTF